MHMRSIWFTPFVLAAGIALAPQPGNAQIFTPSFMDPRLSSSLGVYFGDVGDLAVEGILRRNLGSFDLGVRGGFVDLGDETNLTISGEYRNRLPVSAPIDLSVTSAVQALVGDVDFTGIQFGLSLGSTFVPGSVSLSPYVHPRISFVNGPSDDLDSDIQAEVGMAVQWDSRLGIHVAIGLDDGSPDWGLGLSWR